MLVLVHNDTPTERRVLFPVLQLGLLELARLWCYRSRFLCLGKFQGFLAQLCFQVLTFDLPIFHFPLQLACDSSVINFVYFLSPFLCFKRLTDFKIGVQLFLSWFLTFLYLSFYFGSYLRLGWDLGYSFFRVFWLRFLSFLLANR